MSRLNNLIIIFTLLLLTACGGDEEPTPTPPLPSATPTIRATPTAQATAAAQPAAGAEGLDPIALPTPDPTQVTGEIHVEGSATVYRISAEMARLFAEAGYQATVQMRSTDTGPGFAAFCKPAGIDIVNAGRPIKPAEMAACQAAGREPIEFQVALGALGIVVHPDNTFLYEATLEEVAHIFSNEATNWSDIDPSWPREPITRFSLSEGSGTFDYFIRAVMNPVYAPAGAADPEQGKAILMVAPNVQFIENGSELLEAVSKNPNAIGYVGMLDYQDSAAPVKVLALNGFPALAENFHEGRYPLLRPLYLYSDANVMRAKPQVAAFINLYLSQVNQEVTNMGLNPLSESILNVGRRRWLEVMLGAATATQ